MPSPISSHFFARLSRSAPLLLALAGGLFVPRWALGQDVGSTPQAAPQRSAVKSDDAADAEDNSDTPTFMKLLEDHGKHDRKNERWNAYGQSTYISSWKPSFYAPYTNLNGTPNSLLTGAERSFTGTLTFYLGARLWHGGELWVVPEVISEQPLSQLKGLGGAIQNFELQKGGDAAPTLYLSRKYLRQTFNFGGHRVETDSSPLSMGGSVDSRRLVVAAGNYSMLDFFDKNAFDIDPRQGLMNLSFLTYTAYDFVGDARGYSWGANAELDWDRWAVRYGRGTPPKDPNQLPVDFRLAKYYGDQIELEHHHTLFGQEGQVRALGYRNHENIGRFSDAIGAYKANRLENAAACTAFNYSSDNVAAPDLCWVRRANNKVGIGMFGEQSVAKDIGVFARGMYSDGKTEVDSYTSTDRSLSFGTLAKGTKWSRPHDVAGAGVNFGWISDIHAQYMNMGGVDGFVGDGKIRARAETAFDVFYSANFGKILWATGDYQHIANPGFNADRGPVNVFSLKMHAEF